MGPDPSRFGSTQPITDFVSQGVVSAAIDGILVLLTLGLMFVYSPGLSGLACGVLVIYVGLKLGSLSAMQRANVSAISATAREVSAFIETIRGIPTIKAFGQEINRQRRWQGLKAAAVNAQLKLGRITANFDAVSGAMLAAERVLFVFIAVGLAMKGGFTLGMIFAFQAYKQQFLDASTRLIDQAIRYRLTEVHLTRIADIALSPPEATGAGLRQGISTNPAIELRNVSFRYGAGEPDVISNASLKIEPGEMVALIGPSGGGKTTLLKLMMGLLEPSGGMILIGGLPLSQIDRLDWRSSIGSILQEDRLFAGTLAENVAFFDPEIDHTRVREVCRKAAILQEIEAMPLGLEALVGDMGSSLSGGQRQRVMLARALYGNPVALFMDEGTANLDWASEAAVVDTLSHMSATRIVSAHRPMLVDAATRVFVVQSGRVSQVERQPGADARSSAAVA